MFSSLKRVCTKWGRPGADITIPLCLLLLKQRDMNNKFTIPELPYPANSLAPVISEETVGYHYHKHLQTYIDNLNRLKEGSQFEDADLKSIVKGAEGALFNNAAQTFNHLFYFSILSPSGEDRPRGSLLKAIESRWQSFDNFKKTFSDAAIGLFGSGWVWFCCNTKRELSIMSEPNAGTPLTKGLIPLLTIDVWEHAYYLDHQNRRAEYVDGFWRIINWRCVEKMWEDIPNQRCCRQCLHAKCRTKGDK